MNTHDFLILFFYLDPRIKHVLHVLIMQLVLKVLQLFQNQRKLNMELELKRNLESMLHDKERQLEVEIKSRKEASNSNQQVNEKIYSLEKVVSLQRDRERER